MITNTQQDFPRLIDLLSLAMGNLSKFWCQICNAIRVILLHHSSVCVFDIRSRRTWLNAQDLPILGCFVNQTGTLKKLFDNRIVQTKPTND